MAIDARMFGERLIGPVVFFVVMWLSGCVRSKEVRDETAEEECRRNMRDIWHASLSYCLAEDRRPEWKIAPADIVRGGCERRGSRAKAAGATTVFRA